MQQLNESECNLVITTEMKLDYTQNPIEVRKISLICNGETVFENLVPFVAHRRLYQLGLANLAKKNLI